MTLAQKLFEEHHLEVFRFLRRTTGSQESAEDLLQEVFLRVVRAQSSYRPEGKDRVWLFRIARNVLLNHRRDRSRRPGEEPLNELGTTPVPARLVERLSLAQALGGLDETAREVFLMREVGGLSYDEISDIHGLSPDGVRNRIYRARSALRRTLARLFTHRHQNLQGGRTP
jgi:RNA polymerase sigma-70 factor (ECF subfamily)